MVVTSPRATEGRQIRVLGSRGAVTGQTGGWPSRLHSHVRRAFFGLGVRVTELDEEKTQF